MCSTALFLRTTKHRGINEPELWGGQACWDPYRQGRISHVFLMIALEHTQAHCLLTTELSPPELHLNLANEQAPYNLAPSFSSTLQSAATFTNLKIKTHGIVCFVKHKLVWDSLGSSLCHMQLYFFLFSFLTLKIGPVPRDSRWAGLD